MKTPALLNEVDRKYIARALNHFKQCCLTSALERILIDVIIKRVNSGIRYDRTKLCENIEKNIREKEK